MHRQKPSGFRRSGARVRGALWIALLSITLKAGDVSAQTRGLHMAQNDKAKGTKEDTLVITPAGPVPKDQVHPVGPNEEVRREPDGTYKVVPRRKDGD